MENLKPIAETLLDCAICLNEIPDSTAANAEGADYIGAFCGLECYQVFVAQQKAEAAREQRELEQRKQGSAEANQETYGASEPQASDAP